MAPHTLRLPDWRLCETLRSHDASADRGESYVTAAECLHAAHNHLDSPRSLIVAYAPDVLPRHS